MKRCRHPQVNRRRLIARVSGLAAASEQCLRCWAGRNIDPETRKPLTRWQQPRNFTLEFTHAR